MSKKMGRPAAKLDWSKIDMCCQLGADMVTICGFIDVSRATIERAIGKKHNMTFSEYRDLRMAPAKLGLLKKAREMAMNGDRTMLIFCLKNLCGWTDRTEHSFDESKRTIELKYNLDKKDAPGKDK